MRSIRRHLTASIVLPIALLSLTLVYILCAIVLTVLDCRNTIICARIFALSLSRFDHCIANSMSIPCACHHLPSCPSIHMPLTCLLRSRDRFESGSFDRTLACRVLCLLVSFLCVVAVRRPPPPCLAPPLLSCARARCSEERCELKLLAWLVARFGLADCNPLLRHRSPRSTHTIDERHRHRR